MKKTLRYIFTLEKITVTIVSSWSIASFTPLYIERIDNYRNDIFRAFVYYKAGLLYRFNNLSMI